MEMRVLLKAAGGTGLRSEIVEQLGHQHAVLALAVVRHLARRRRGQDQRVLGHRDRRQPVGVGAEAALIGVAAGGVDDDELGLGALLGHRVQHVLDADAVAADIGFLPDRGIDRDHEALAADLDAVAAEEQHHHAVGLDLVLEPADGAGHVVLGGVLDHVDVKALAAQRSRQAARVIDGLRQRRGRVRVVTIADDEGDAGSRVADRSGMLGRDRLGGIERTLVQRRMGADHQRHQADQGGGNGDGAAGDAGIPRSIAIQFPSCPEAPNKTRQLVA